MNNCRYLQLESSNIINPGMLPARKVDKSQKSDKINISPDILTRVSLQCFNCLRRLVANATNLEFATKLLHH